MPNLTAWVLIQLLTLGSLFVDIAQAQIIPDGKTQTHLTYPDPLGNVAEVRADTIVGQSGINSFTDFTVAEKPRGFLDTGTEGRG